MSVEQDIADFIARYIERWNVNDIPTLRSMWDECEENPIYVAEESEPMVGWPAIEGYWGVDRSKSERLITYDRLVAKAASDDIGIAFYHMRWNLFIPGNRLYPRPFGGAVRVTAMLRRREDGWRMFHYMEAPLAMLIQARQAAEAAVDPALHERLARKQAG